MLKTTTSRNVAVPIVIAKSAPAKIVLAGFPANVVVNWQKDMSLSKSSRFFPAAAYKFDQDTALKAHHSQVHINFSSKINNY